MNSNENYNENDPEDRFYEMFSEDDKNFFNNVEKLDSFSDGALSADTCTNERIYTIYMKDFQDFHVAAVLSKIMNFCHVQRGIARDYYNTSKKFSMNILENDLFNCGVDIFDPANNKEDIDFMLDMMDNRERDRDRNAKEKLGISVAATRMVENFSVLVADALDKGAFELSAGSEESDFCCVLSERIHVAQDLACAKISGKDSEIMSSVDLDVMFPLDERTLKMFVKCCDEALGYVAEISIV